MSNHLRPENVCGTREMIAELTRLYRLDKNWVKVEPEADRRRYRAYTKHRTWLDRYMINGSEVMGMHAMSAWLGDGPKVFKPSKAQQEALANVAVNLTVADYRQPFPAILVETAVAPYYGTIVSHTGDLIVVDMLSKENVEDTVTTVYNWGQPIEESLTQYDEECKATAAQSHRAARIAVNACLALAHYAHHSSMLFPHEAASDKGLIARGGPAAERAKERLKLAPTLLEFTQDIRLHSEETSYCHEGEPTGREVRSHWRKGHWRRQHWGTGNAETKTIFIKPVLVRADIAVGDTSETSVIYRG